MGKATEIRRSEIVDGALAVAAEVEVRHVTTQAIADRVVINEAP